MTALAAILNEAIPRWASLTGTKLGTNKFSFRLGSDSEFQDYDLQKYIKNLNAARMTDATGVTAILLLRGLFDAYVRELSFTGHAMIFEATKVEKTLTELREFRALIHQPVCDAAATGFVETVRAAAQHYSYDVTRLADLLSSEYTLGQLRLAAATSLDKLAVHQFAQGKPDVSPLRYNSQIFEFLNVNSFIAALRQQWVSGITLALIRGQDAYQSYFAIGLRNGETITVLTDFQEGAHPDYQRITRRPDRRLEERADAHYFPYGLLKNDAVAKAKNKTALVPLNAKAVVIEEIPNLESGGEFVWLMLLFDLIAERFGKDDFKTPELSYTGEMVVTPHVLVAESDALVRSGHYQPLVLPKLTVATTTAEAADNEMRVGHNAWMEERYRDRVPEIILDVVGERRALEVGKQVAKTLPGKVKAQNIPRERRQPGTIVFGGFDHRLVEITPDALDPTYFGTKAQIDRNRTWAARKNMMRVIQRCATADFAAKQGLIMRWIRARLERNMPALMKAVAHGELQLPEATWQSDIDHDFPAHDQQVWTTANGVRQKIAKSGHHAYPRMSMNGDGIRFGEWKWPNTLCYLDAPTRATVFTVIEPTNPRALAAVLGIPEKKLPWPLQHWTTSEPYTGNSILDRIDPQDSLLDNPWRHLELQVIIGLCKRAYARVRKEHGLPPHNPALNDNDDD